MEKEADKKPAADILREISERLVTLETVTGKLLQRMDKVEKAPPAGDGDARRKPWN